MKVRHQSNTFFRISLLASALMLAACAERATVPEIPPSLSGRAGSQAVVATEKVESMRLPASRPMVQLATRRESDAAVAMDELAGSGQALTPVFAPEPSLLRQAGPDTERYQHFQENPVRLVASEPVSTFSLDVDTGSYANVRRFINQGRLPPTDAVRIEELVNYFPYDYPLPTGAHPFGVGTELSVCPWNDAHWLLRVSVRADAVDAPAMPPANLVFLVDVSGSMDDPAKLPLLKQSLKLLVGQLRAKDRVSLVVYAGREAVVLEPTAGNEQAKISNAIDQLGAGGSTAGEAGIRLAYRMARQGFVAGGINRVLLATDGDFNVGVNDTEQLKSTIEHERASGVSLSTLGFGAGNYNEALMEQLADVGNGNYSYIDNLQEGRKVLVDQLHSTLLTVAQDVKVQIEFNPAFVGEYRLVGYENRLLRREDFNNDAVDAGEVGAGASVTALYELTPADARSAVDPLRYGQPAAGNFTGTGAMNGVKGGAKNGARSGEIAFLRLRYQPPGGGTSRLLEYPVQHHSLKPEFATASEDLRFAAAVAGFGQLLRGARHTGRFGYEEVIELAAGARGRDEYGYRGEFLGLVRLAKSLGGS